MARPARTGTVKTLLRRAVPPAARERLKRPLARRGLVVVPGAARGLVSVVVVVGAEPADRLSDTLASLRAQTHAFLDVVVPADDAAVREAPDSRVRALGGGTSTAEAAAAAQGDYLVFVRAGDRLPPRAVELLSASLARSGSDVAVGRLRQAGRVDADVEAAQRRLHAARRTAVDAETCPDVLADLGVGNRMFRTAFWRAAGLRLEDPDWLLDPVVAEAALAAARFDVLPEVTYELVGRGITGVFGATPRTLPQLAAWRGRADAVQRLVDQHPAAGVRDAWVRHVLDEQLPRFLDDAERASGAEWVDLVAAVRGWLDLASEQALSRVGVEDRSKLWLAAHDRRRDLEDFVASRWFDEGALATTVRAVEVHARWPEGAGADALPPEVTRLSEHETPLVATVHRVRRRGDVLEVDLTAFVRRVDLHDAVPDIGAELVHESGARLPVPVEARPDPAASRPLGERFQDYGPGAVRLDVDGGRLVATPGRWTLHVSVEVHGLRREGPVTGVDRQGGVPQLAPLPVAGHEVGVVTEGGLALDVSPAGAPAARPAGPVLEVREVILGDEAVHVTGAWLGGAPRAWSLELGSPRISVAGGAVDDAEQVSISLPLRGSELGLPPSWLPTGPYRLRVRGAGDRVRVVLGEELRGRLPEEQVAAHHRLRLRLQGAEPVLQLGPPLAEDELGAYAQQRLRDWYGDQAARARVDPRLVYLQSYTGETATDNQLELFHELRARRPDLRLVWGVADASCRLPEAAEPVLIRSRAWYATLATARCVLTNIDLERWFRKRPDQLVVQTYHGHPSKTMGVGLWRSKELSPRRVDQELDRTGRVWDVLLSPSPEMERHFREQFAFEGELLSLGFPRDDVLRSPRAVECRDRTRERLEIQPGQTVVLYAPTWREDLATAPRAAAMVDHLDLEAAAEALGDRYVLLVRGHRFHARNPDRRRRTARIVDVTDYPEINDLVLASDVAVLDYSSLRFDYAQTGKPMLFLVPDLDAYTGGLRGFLFDFRPTAPGPLLSTTEEVVAALRDLPAVAERHRPQIDELNRTYNRLQDGHAAARVAEALLDRLDRLPD